MSSSSSPTLSFALSPPPLLSPSAIRFNPAAQQHRPFHPRALMHLAAGSELELTRARCSAQPAFHSLLRLVTAELGFLASARSDPAAPLSSNPPHLTALHLLLTHPGVGSPSWLSPY